MKDHTQFLQTTEELDANIIKAYFHKDNYIPDNISKAFNKDVEITLDSLLRLNSRVIEKLRLHNNYGIVTNVDIKFEDKKAIHFGSWVEFSNYNWNETKPINTIVMKWDFNANFDNLKIPQKHTLLVKLSNGIKPEEMLNIIFSGNFGEVNEIENNFFPVIVQSTFINRVFGSELVDVVEKWVDTIIRPTWAGRRILNFLKIHKVKAAKIIQWATNLIIIFGSLFATLSSLNNLLPEVITNIERSLLIDLIFQISIMSIVWRFSTTLSRWFGKTFYNLVADYGHSYVFSITKQDIERKDRMQKEKTYDKIKLGLVVASNIAVNIFFILLERFI